MLGLGDDDECSDFNVPYSHLSMPMANSVLSNNIKSNNNNGNNGRKNLPPIHQGPIISDSQHNQQPQPQQQNTPPLMGSGDLLIL